MNQVRVEFVNGYTDDSKEKRRLDRLARTHAAKVGSSRSLQRRKTSQSAALPERQQSRRVPPLSHHDTVPTRMRPNRAPSRSQQSLEEDYANAGDDRPLSWTLSPVFGPQGFANSGTATGYEACETMNYYLQVLAPHVMSPPYRRARLERSGRYPVAYHSTVYTAALHHGLLRGFWTPLERQRMLYHKAETLRLLQAEVSDLRPERIELLLSVITHVLREEPGLDEMKLHDAAVLPFMPHTPSSCWMNVYGRTKTVAAHARALITLVEYAGGLEKISSDTVRELRVTDLISASTACVRPAFPNVRTFDQEAYQALLNASLTPGQRPGEGFAALPCSRLPSEALETFRQLAAVDQVLGLHRHLGVESPRYHLILKARNWTHHRLLSLPAWERLSELEQSQCWQATYEASRVTAILYSTAVVFPMPAHTGWHLNLLTTLKAVHRSIALLDRPEVAELMLWSLYIASMASVRTSHRNFFVAALRTSLRTSGLVSWSAVQQVLGRFLWSETACGGGGKLIWDLLGMETKAPPIHEASGQP